MDHVLADRGQGGVGLLLAELQIGNTVRHPVPLRAEQAQRARGLFGLGLRQEPRQLRLQRRAVLLDQLRVRTPPAPLLTFGTGLPGLPHCLAELLAAGHVGLDELARLVGSEIERPGHFPCLPRPGCFRLLRRQLPHPRHAALAAAPAFLAPRGRAQHQQTQRHTRKHPRRFHDKLLFAFGPRRAAPDPQIPVGVSLSPCRTCVNGVGGSRQPPDFFQASPRPAPLCPKTPTPQGGPGPGRPGILSPPA
jgi:hypothetical protein